MSEKTLSDFYLESDEDAAGIALEGDRRISAIRASLAQAEERVRVLEAVARAAKYWLNCAEINGAEFVARSATKVMVDALAVALATSPPQPAAPLVVSATAVDSPRGWSEKVPVVAVNTGRWPEPITCDVECVSKAQAREIARVLSEACMPGKG